MSEISIIVPVYNVEKYLENCIESILNQTFKDFELILVDDGSTDNSGKICDIYEKKDSRIKVIHKNNGGLSSARNAGIDIAGSKYIGFVDSDDSIHPKMYEILYDLQQIYDVDISMCSFKKIYENIDVRNKYVEKLQITEMDNIKAINNLYNSDIRLDLIVAWNKLYKKELFNNIRFELGRLHEDEFIIHKILYKSKRLVHINRELYYYLQREGSIMSNISLNSRIDYILAISDRMKFLDYIKLYDACKYTYKTYIKEFFEVYNNAEKDGVDEVLKILRQDFISNIKILFKLKDEGIKAKILWGVLCINPKIYKAYRIYKESY